jgi:hypothetical protein
MSDVSDVRAALRRRRSVEPGYEEKREVWLSGQEEKLLARTTGMAGVSLATHFCTGFLKPAPVSQAHEGD